MLLVIIKKNTKALPAWAAADVVGAGYSAVVAGIGSYSTTGEVNWGEVRIAAVGGAVAGSTGIIGKAGKWLSGLFKRKDLLNGLNINPNSYCSNNYWGCYGTAVS